MSTERASQFNTIVIPAEIYNQLEEQLGHTEFSSVSDYVCFILREVLSDDGGREAEGLEREDEEEVAERLRSLGYID